MSQRPTNLPLPGPALPRTGYLKTACSSGAVVLKIRIGNPAVNQLHEGPSPHSTYRQLA